MASKGGTMDSDEITVRQRPPFRYLDGFGEWDESFTEMTGWVYLQPSEQRLYAASASSVLLIEALAQLSGVLLWMRTGAGGNTGGGVLSTIDEAQFGTAQLSHSGIFLKTRIKRDAFPYFVLEGTAKQDGRLLAACVLSVRSMARPEAQQ
jgi:hypothetical protein